MLSALKNFFVTFLIAAIVFGSVAYFATQFLTDTISGIFDAEASELDSILNPGSDQPPAVTTPVTEPDGSTASPPEEEPITGDSFNMLFIVTDYQPDIFSDYLPSDDTLAAWQADPNYTTGILGDEYRRPRACAILLLRADKERKEFVITPFPSIARINTISGSHTMADLYNLYGSDVLVSTVAAMTGLTVDHYLLVNITEVSDIITELGGVPMYFSRELYYNGQLSTSVKPSAEEADFLPLLYGIGKNTVDGPGAVAVLMNEEFIGGVNDRCAMLSTFFQEMLMRMTEMSEADFTAFYDKIRENAWVDTSLTTKDLVARIDLIYRFRDEAFTVKTLNYPGRFVAATETEKAYFEPNTAAGIAQYKPYRPMLAENQTVTP